MTCFLKVQLLPSFMNQENMRLSQSDACAVASDHHCLPSCYFLLEVAFASFYDVKFEFESVVSRSPILSRPRHLSSIFVPPSQHCNSQPVCQFHRKLPWSWWSCTMRHSPAGSIQLTPLQFYLLSLTSLELSLILNQIHRYCPICRIRLGFNIQNIFFLRDFFFTVSCNTFTLFTQDTVKAALCLNYSIIVNVFTSWKPTEMESILKINETQTVF